LDELNWLLDEVRELIGEGHKLFPDYAFAEKKFVPGETPVPVSGKIVGLWEVDRLIDAIFDFHWTDGTFVSRFESRLARAVGARKAAMCNSGSSANFLAVAAVKEHLGWKDGDVIVTTACGFPTTLNAILMNKLHPVFVDVELPYYNANAGVVIDAVKKHNAVGVFMAHTMGNPFDAIHIGGHTIVIEDNCDALMSELSGHKTGTLGTIATQSFYPAHHITTGEGGAVLTRIPALDKLVRSYRDWGRDCWCGTGQDNTCGKRFVWEFPNLPVGFDHKYIYSRIGGNMKSTDLNAAIGIAQLKRLDLFTAQRQENFDRIYGGLKASGMEEFFVLPEPTPLSKPSWFGFLLTIRDEAPFTRNAITAHLNSKNIATRNLFAGNLLRQPAYASLNAPSYGLLETSDKITRDTFWIGCYPGITEEMCDYMVEEIVKFTVETWAKGV
jgi:CDP-6-deoxy-D-xylo-4-hexulose-3-dehydrase